MKNILLIGAARSGKSTLARMISQKFGLSIVCVDSIITAFQNTFPDLNISHAQGSLCKRPLTSFVSAYANALMYDHPHERFVIEGYHINLDDNIQKFFTPNLFEIIVLGYPQLTPTQVLENVRKYENKTDYTSLISDDELLKTLTRHAQYSINFEKKAKELNLQFIDTSYNRANVLENFLKTIKNSSEL